VAIVHDGSRFAKGLAAKATAALKAAGANDVLTVAVAGRQKDYTALIGLAAFLGYLITNLLVLYASRIREYFADRGSVALGNQPSWLASALYKLVYGSARIPKEALKEVEGLKAFFASDPSRAMYELRELRGLDLDRSGTIDSAELESLRTKTIKLSFGDKVLELLTTHPNMLKRIKALSGYNTYEKA
jgi:heat shock protein HtpX